LGQLLTKLNRYHVAQAITVTGTEIQVASAQCTHMKIILK